MYTGEDIKKHRQSLMDNILKSFEGSEPLGGGNSLGLINKSEEEGLEKAHQQGDIHPNGKWYWESSAAGGKGDWRVIGGRRHKQSSSVAPKKEDKLRPMTDEELTEKFQEDLIRINDLKPKAVDFSSIKSIKEGLEYFVPGIKFKKEGKDWEVYVDKYDTGRTVKIDDIFAFSNFVQYLLDEQTHRREALNPIVLKYYSKLSEKVWAKVDEGNKLNQQSEFFQKKYKENIEAIKLNLEIKGDIKPMTFEEANHGRGNPFYYKDGLYQINCQTCVVVHELRLRGFDVTAKPKVRNIQDKMAMDSTYVWENPVDGERPRESRVYWNKENIYENMKGARMTASRGENMRINLNKEMKETGRYEVAYIWKSGSKRYGHIITAERHADGKLTYYDPQTGKAVSETSMIQGADVSHSIRVIRVDNLLLKSDLVREYVNKNSNED